MQEACHFSLVLPILPADPYPYPSTQPAPPRLSLSPPTHTCGTSVRLIKIYFTQLVGSMSIRLTLLLNLYSSLQKISQSVMFFMRITMECIAAIIVDALVSWYFLVGILPLFFLYISILAYFITTSR